MCEKKSYCREVILFIRPTESPGKKEMCFQVHSPFYNSHAEKIDEKLGRARCKCSQFNSITLIVLDQVADENEAPWDREGWIITAPTTM